MAWRVWCRVLVVAAAVVAKSGAAPNKKECQCLNERPCVPFDECPASESVVKPIVFNPSDRHGNNETLICCPILEEEIDLRRENLLPKSDVCGVHAEKIYRIIDGDDAEVNAYPWMALLGYKDPANPSWLCAGTLVNEQYVVTAAHCIFPGLVTVRLGEHNIATNIDCRAFKSKCSPPQDLAIKEAYRHEEYQKNGRYSNDIAIIHLKTKAKLGLSVRPLCLPPADLDVKKFLGSRGALVAGWGNTETGLPSDILQVVEVPLVDKEECDAKYPISLTDGMMCYGGIGHKNACNGDSGGPVFQSDEKTNQYVMLGIVSFGKIPCGTPGIPAVYTHVPYYRDWIVAQLKA